MNQQGPTVYHRELCFMLCGSVAGRGIEGRMDTCKSLCCSPETITILLIGYTPIKKLEKAMAPHSSTLAWKVPWTEEPGRL